MHANKLQSPIAFTNPTITAEATKPSTTIAKSRSVAVIQDNGPVGLSSLGALNTMELGQAEKLIQRGAHLPLIKSGADLKQITNPEVLTLVFKHAAEPDVSHFRGRMNGEAQAAPHHENTAVGAIVKQLTKSGILWRGKQALSPADPASRTSGTGNNHVLGTDIFPFNFRVENSELDSKIFGSKKALVLHYEEPGQEGRSGSLLNKLTGVDAVYDAMREVKPGIFLGMAAIKDKRNDAMTHVVDAGLHLAHRDERVAGSQNPVPIIYFSLESDANPDFVSAYK